MSDTTLIGVEEARRHVEAGEAILACAYADEAQCWNVALEGSTTLAELENRRRTLAKDQEIIFYCA